MNTHMVYKWTRDNGQYYIGIHTNTDGKDPTTDGYIGSGIKFLNTFNNTPRDQWTRETTILDTRDHAESLEARLVDLETLNDPLCLNLKTGGGCGLASDETKEKLVEAWKTRPPPSAETKAKISAAVKNRPPASAETRAKLSASNKGKTRSAEARANNAAAQKGKTMSAEAKAKMSAKRKGVTLTAEHRAKIGIAHKGRIISAETRAKISAAHIGKNISAETRAKLSAAGVGRPKSAKTRAKLSAALKGKTRSAEARANMSAAQQNRAPISAETRAKLSAAGKGRIHSPETLAKMAAAQMGNTHSLGSKHTDEWKYMMSAKLKGRSQPKIKCDHCDVMMNAGNLTRWHNDNCKHKPNPYKLFLVSVSPQATRTPIFNAMRLAA